MKLADQVLLAQLRESALQSVPDDQWNLVLGEVEKAGGVRNLEGYAQTLVFDAIRKASFANRSDAGRYAANVRWQGQGKADRANSGKNVANYGNSKKGFDEWANSDPSLPSATVGNLKSWIKAGYLDRDNLSDADSSRLSPKDGGNIADDLEDDDGEGDYIDEWNEKNPDDYFSINNPTKDFRPKVPDKLVNPNMPPDYNDYGDEPPRNEPFTPATAEDEARRKLRGEMVPMDLKNPQASQATRTPESPAKIIASEVKSAYNNYDAAKIVNQARLDADDAISNVFREEKLESNMRLTEDQQRKILGQTSKEMVAQAKTNLTELRALSDSAKKAFKERFGQDIDKYMEENGYSAANNPYKGM